MILSDSSFSYVKFLVHISLEERMKLLLLSGASKYKKQRAIIRFVKTWLSSVYFKFHMTMEMYFCAWKY